jgi:DNA polymerase sigma
MKKSAKPKKPKRISNEQLEDLLLSNYKPRRPSEEAKKRRKELLEELRPIAEELFPNAKRLG